ncbi:MAG: DNA-binding response regulator [Deltaproteobacteria bacterium]|nr:DNA-binding response regulator [Deltaproteobacteria bacterium]HCH64460.1 DNA-binding response regulator [Deltaproteobacteria bacterium]
MSARVLVVDDETSNRTALERILVREGLEVVHAADGEEALQRVRLDRPHLMLTDFKMPGMTGLELLKLARSVSPALEVIVMTAYGTVETAVEAMKEGAADFVTKPLRRADIVRAVRKALERRRLVMENQDLREQLARMSPEEVVGRSAPMQALIEEAGQVADSEATVLITGESGTGKGRLARWIHEHSPRRGRKMITVNCGALPENLLESELFGHEAGSFTGATGRREGRFDLARGGTLFLDEVTEMSPAVQVKLLRVLQDGEYERVGGTRTLKADVRILAATNRDPEQAIRDGQLREDLFYRLNVIGLQLPPLRERRDDVPLLAQHFLRIHSARNRREVSGFAPGAVDALVAWLWPGNVRELENAVERAVVLCRGDTIERAHLPRAMRSAEGSADTLSFRVGTPLKDVERAMIETTLAACDGDKSMAARLLGITARTIYRREADWRAEDSAGVAEN